MNVSTNRWAARAATSLLLLVGSALAVAPATVTAAAGATGCVPGTTHADAKARPGRPGHQDPNALSDAQVRQRETDLSALLADRRRPAGAMPLATVTIPVVVHIIAENSTRAGGYLPDSMIQQQIAVLNDSYDGGAVGGATTPFAFQLHSITRNVRPQWYPIVYGSRRTRDEGGTAGRRQGDAQHLHR